MNHWQAILIVDFGLVILIWITQLISYPSFQYLDGDKLLEWHSQYTFRIGIIVMPLMLAQIGLKAWDLMDQFVPIAFISALLVGLIWASTFFQAVPLHNQIASGQTTPEIVDSLVRVNWIRTVLWTAVFGLDLGRYLWLKT